MNIVKRFLTFFVVLSYISMQFIPGVFGLVFAATENSSGMITGNTNQLSTTMLLHTQVGKGKFIVSYEDTALTGDILNAINQIKKAGYIELVLNGIADNIWLKTDIPVVFKDCGYANAFWSPESQSITYCYEMIQAYTKDYSTLSMENKAILLGATREDIIAGTTLFILAHEVAHGLVNLYHLPITGREENVVDQFATLLLTSADKPTFSRKERIARYALYGALFFKEVATHPSDLSRSVFADEHGLGQQRFYDIMCLVFGSDPEFYSTRLTKGLSDIEHLLTSPDIINNEEKKTKLLTNADKNNILPYERALQCPAEFQSAYSAWDYLLDTFAQKSENLSIGGSSLSVLLEKYDIRPLKISDKIMLFVFQKIEK